MVNRHRIKGIKAKSTKQSKSNETYSVPKVVAKPKSKKAQKQEDIEINRGNNENDLYNTYVHDIKKLSKLDLGVINRPEYYPNAKKDRSYNYGVQRAKDDLQLLSFLLSNLKPHYKQQIISSSQFDNIIKKYLGIDEFSENLTRAEKEVTLSIASQMLVNSLTTIKRTMPPEFSEVLNQIGKPYFDMIKAISDFSRANNIKTIPPINIPDGLR